MSFLKWFMRRPTNRTLNRDLAEQQEKREMKSSAELTDRMSFPSLQAACARQDPTAVEVALQNAFTNELSADLVPVLIELCQATWHTRHEDVVLALQQVGDVTAVNALEEVAYVNLPYLDYDDNFALARKATWALADIGSSSAKEALCRIASSQNPIKAAYAKKRLQNWDGELHRKRN